ISPPLGRRRVVELPHSAFITLEQLTPLASSDCITASRSSHIRYRTIPRSCPSPCCWTKSPLPGCTAISAEANERSANCDQDPQRTISKCRGRKRDQRPGLCCREGNALR